MQNKNLEKFYEKVRNNENLQNLFIEELKTVQTPEELLKFVDEKIIPESKKLGYEFTGDEFLEYEKEILSQLIEDDLENVSGGASTKSIMAGSLAALSFFSGSDLAKVGAIISNKDAVSITDNMLKVQTEQERPQENQTQNGERNGSGENINSNSNISAGVAQVVQESLEQKINSLKDDNQKLYFLEALNVIDPFVFLKEDGFLQNLRKYGNFDRIGMGTIPNGTFGRLYKNDKGKGIAELVKDLFPSNSGNLKRNEDYSKDKIANALNKLYDWRSKFAGISSNFNEAQFLNQYLETFIKNGFSYKDVKYNNNVLKNIESILTSFGKDMGEEKITERKNFKGNYVEVYTPEGKKKLKENWNAFISELNLENGLEKDVFLAFLEEINTSDVPRYTVERILMSFILDACNNQAELEKILGEIASKLSASEVSQVNDNIYNEIKAQKERLEKIRTVLNKEATKNSPYKKSACEFGPANKISKVENAKVIFDSSIFPDCADTTARHFLNLITYSNNQDWNFFEIPSEGPQLEQLKEKLEEVKKAIDEKTEVKFYPLKERVQMFMIHQKKVGVDADDEQTRTLWEYVICNMDGDQGNDKYSLKYNHDGNFELKTGFDNLMKLMYNIAKEFNVSTDKLNAAKEAIDRFESENKEDLYNELKTIIKLFNNKEFNVRAMAKENDGVTFEVEDLLFSVVQHVDVHAFVQHNPISTSKEDVSEKDSDELKLFFGVFPKNSFYKNYSSTPSQLGSPDENNMTEYEKKLRLIYALEHSLSGTFNATDFKFISIMEKEKIDEGIKPVIDKIEEYFLPRIKEIYVSRDDSDKVIVEYKNNEYMVWKIVLESEKCKNIDFSKFYNLESLKIGNNCFCGNNNLKDIILPDKLQTLEIGSNAFNGSAIKKFDIPKCHLLKSLMIGKSAFKSTSELKEFSLPLALESLEISEEAFAFSAINNFNVFSCPLKRLSIGKSAFKFTSKLKKFILPSTLQDMRIYESAFCASAISELDIPSCSELKNLYIGESSFLYSQIGKFDISKCYRLKALRIGSQAFADSQLSKVILPENLDSLEIGEFAFSRSSIGKLNLSRCNNLKRLVIKEGAFVKSGINYPEQMEEIIKLSSLETKDISNRAFWLM